MRWVTALVVLTTIAVRGQDTPSPVLVFVDLGQISSADRERLTAVTVTISTGAETRFWTGLDDGPVARHPVSFAEAFDIFRGNTSVLQTVKARECAADSSPSCGADLPLRARQSLDAFDDLARATLRELTKAVNDLRGRDEPRPHAVVFLTAGLPSRAEPRRELDALTAALRRSNTTLAIVDAGTTGRASAGLTRMTAVTGAASYFSSDDSLKNLRTSLSAVTDERRRTLANPSGGAHLAPSRLPPEVVIASRHAVAFAEAAETLLADEHYVQEVKTRPSSTSMPRYSTAGITVEKRALDSEVALIQLKSGELWLLARDVQRIDDRPVPDAQRVRLPSIRADTEAEAVAQLKEIATQGARFNIGGIRRDLNVPTLALWLLTPGILSRFEFSMARTQNIEGRDAVEVRFKERKPPYLFNVDDVPVPTSGRFWLDRQRRAVIRTELTLQKTIEGRTYAQAQIVVNYYYDGKANAWVPRNMAEQYYASHIPQFVIANATYSNVRRFSSSVRIVK